MLVNYLTASYIKDLLDMMRKFRLRKVSLIVQCSESNIDSLATIELRADALQEKISMDLLSGYSIPERVILSVNEIGKKKFIEKFKSSNMYKLKIKYSEV